MDCIQTINWIHDLQSLCSPFQIVREPDAVFVDKEPDFEQSIQMGGSGVNDRCSDQLFHGRRADVTTQRRSE